MALRLPVRYKHIMHSTWAFGRWKQSAQLSLSAYHHVMSRSFQATPMATHTTFMQTSFQARQPLLIRKEHFKMGHFNNQWYTTNASEQSSQDQSLPQSDKPKSSTERIKVILKEYGTVGFVFHISVSLCSVGTCYILVSNGLDVDKVLEYFNVGSSGTKKGASTFAIAYVLHKFLLPIRAAITVACVPLIVRKLRSMGLMKGVAKTVANSAKNKVQ